MEKKIFKNLLMIATMSIVIAFVLCTIFFYNNFQKYVIETNKIQAEYLKYLADDNDGKLRENINFAEFSRVTLIKSDGTVYYDSAVDYKLMENHSDRPEVISALEIGYGESKRMSDTISKETYYYAVKLNNGNILRVSSTVDTIFKMTFSMVPFLVFAIVALLIVATLVSKFMTKNIVEPINNINPSNPESVFVYDEISPLISRIKSQNEIISFQMNDLREKKIEFEAITENMNEGFIIIGPDSKVISYNNSALKFLNVNAGEERISNIIVFNRSKRFQKVAKLALSGKHAECILELNYKMYQVIANPVEDEGKVTGAVILIMDATEKEQRDVLRREFSANVSHELKTPLTSISGYAEIMETGMVKNADIVKFAGIIHTEARRLIDLVGDIIKISKLDEGSEQFEDEEIDIYRLCKEIVVRLDKQIKDKDINIKIQGESCTINSVKQIVDEIIFNLVDNGIKYNKNNGDISIKIIDNKEDVTVIVKDTGIGIPKGDIERIFERFYRVDKSHSKEVGGTGLGLSIVKHGALYLGAAIKVESEENKGTTMYVTFKR